MFDWAAWYLFAGDDFFFFPGTLSPRPQLGAAGCLRALRGSERTFAQHASAGKLQVLFRCGSSVASGGGIETDLVRIAATPSPWLAGGQHTPAGGRRARFESMRLETLRTRTTSGRVQRLFCLRMKRRGRVGTRTTRSALAGFLRT